jgi:hypothetical protein
MPNYTNMINNYVIINTDGDVALYRYLKETKKYIHMEKHYIKTYQYFHIDSLEEPIKVYSFNETPYFTKVNKDDMKNKTYMTLWNDSSDFNKIRYVESLKFGKSLFFDKSININKNVDSLFNSLIPKISKLYKLFLRLKEDIEDEQEDNTDAINEFKEYIIDSYSEHQVIKYPEMVNDISFIFYKLKLINNPTYANYEDTILEIHEFIEKLFDNDIIKKCPLCRCENKIILEDTASYKKLFVESDDECCICMDSKANIKLPTCNHLCVCFTCFTNL